MKLGELLDYVSIGQMIRIVLLDDELEEIETIEFENDSKDYRYQKIEKSLFKKYVEFISSTEDDYLRIEVLKD